ncbi:MAG: arylamine N-acetyltransferase [Alcanivorax sp.]|nr:arylamine N-acetyltransferase [Alcanivorax sp.]
MIAVDLSAYLARIGYDGALDASLETLAALHWHHVNRIPFEALNPFLGRPVSLSTGDLETKLVRQQRGGYCHEHAQLFGQVLRQLGFAVRPLLARVLWGRPDEAPTPAATHQLLLVTLGDEPYVVDIGFGALTGVAPLRLHERGLQLTRHETFRIRAHQDLHQDMYVVEALEGGIWRALYRFSMATVGQADYEMANWFTACHPSSPFVGQLIASRVDGGVRHILHNDRYTRRHADGRIERHLRGGTTAILALLSDVMGIRLQDTAALTHRLETLLRRQVSARLCGPGSQRALIDGGRLLASEPS